MPPLLFYLPCLVALLTFLAPLADASQIDHNVDIQDPSISYFGTWEQLPNALGGGHHMETTDLSAFALFSFTGVAVYYVATRWPHPVTTDISIDDQTPVRIDLQDPHYNSGSGAIAPPGVITAFVGLENMLHTVRISVHPGEKFAVVERFIYTTLDAEPTTSSFSPKIAVYVPASPDPDPAATNPPPNSLPSNSNASDSGEAGRNIALGLGIGGGILVVSLISLLMWCYIRRERDRRRWDCHITAPEPYYNIALPYISKREGAGPLYHQPPHVPSGYLSASASSLQLTSGPHTRASSQLDEDSSIHPGSHRDSILPYTDAGTVAGGTPHQPSRMIPGYHNPSSTSHLAAARIHGHTPSHLNEVFPQAPPVYTPHLTHPGLNGSPLTKVPRKPGGKPKVKPVPRSKAAPARTYQHVLPKLPPHHAQPSFETTKSGASSSLNFGSTGELRSQSSEGTLQNSRDDQRELPLPFRSMT